MLTVVFLREFFFFFFFGFDKMWDICEVNVLFVVRCLKSIKFLVQLCNLLQNLYCTGWAL